MKELYASFCQGEIVVTDIKTAEMTKVVENTFRAVNIAFANELAKICRHDNMDVYESRDVMSIIREIEALDENYYSTFPGFQELAKVYGDPNSEKLYRIRDLYHHYRMQYAQDHDIRVYDVTDERQSGSRRE